MSYLETRAKEEYKKKERKEEMNARYRGSSSLRTELSRRARARIGYFLATVCSSCYYRVLTLLVVYTRSRAPQFFYFSFFPSPLLKVPSTHPSCSSASVLVAAQENTNTHTHIHTHTHTYLHPTFRHVRRNHRPSRALNEIHN